MSITSRTQGSTGNAYFQKQVSAQLARLNKQIPDEYRLSESYLTRPPLNVTSIPETCGILSQKELAITDLDATDVLAGIGSGKYTAVEVVTAFGKRAAIAHQLTACLTDFFLEEGIQRAKELDDYFKANNKTVGPLHGLPISIKVRVCRGLGSSLVLNRRIQDHMPLKGRWGSGGFLSNLERSSHDSLLTSTLRELGAGEISKKKVDFCIKVDSF